ncbi:hypothetical protein B0H14DRAFT_3629319 [Mycena olivaceomarginata]|nr:hypothetical protein B0H14DRAFT_3629319 [Mycena olivaceomarginata]
MSDSCLWKFPVPPTSATVPPTSGEAEGRGLVATDNCHSSATVPHSPGTIPTSALSWLPLETPESFTAGVSQTPATKAAKIAAHPSQIFHITSYAPPVADYAYCEGSHASYTPSQFLTSDVGQSGFYIPSGEYASSARHGLSPLSEGSLQMSHTANDALQNTYMPSVAEYVGDSGLEEQEQAVFPAFFAQPEVFYTSMDGRTYTVDELFVDTGFSPPRPPPLLTEPAVWYASDFASIATNAVQTPFLDPRLLGGRYASAFARRNSSSLMPPPPPPSATPYARHGAHLRHTVTPSRQLSMVSQLYSQPSTPSTSRSSTPNSSRFVDSAYTTPATTPEPVDGPSRLPSSGPARLHRNIRRSQHHGTWQVGTSFHITQAPLAPCPSIRTLTKLEITQVVKAACKAQVAGKEMVRCGWEKCTVEIRRSALVDHLRVVHALDFASKTKGACGWDSKCKWIQASSLRKHFLEKHLDLPPVACPTCTSTFGRGDSLRRHLEG